MKTVACIFFLVVAINAVAETLFKVVGPDGKITYTDRPPADGKSTTTLRFADAPSTPLPDAVLKYQAALQKSMQSRLSQAKKADAIGATTLFSAVWCGYCTRAKAYLQAERSKRRAAAARRWQATNRFQRKRVRQFLFSKKITANGFYQFAVIFGFAFRAAIDSRLNVKKLQEFFL